MANLLTLVQDDFAYQYSGPTQNNQKCSVGLYLHVCILQISQYIQRGGLYLENYRSRAFFGSLYFLFSRITLQYVCIPW